MTSEPIEFELERCGLHRWKFEELLFCHQFFWKMSSRLGVIVQNVLQAFFLEDSIANSENFFS